MNPDIQWTPRGAAVLISVISLHLLMLPLFRVSINKHNLTQRLSCRKSD